MWLYFYSLTCKFLNNNYCLSVTAMVNLSFLFVSTILFLVLLLPTTTDLSKKKFFFETVSLYRPGWPRTHGDLTHSTHSQCEDQWCALPYSAKNILELRAGVFCDFSLCTVRTPVPPDLPALFWLDHLLTSGIHIGTLQCPLIQDPLNGRQWSYASSPQCLVS